MKLLDTTFLVHHYRGNERVERYLAEHDPRTDGDLFTTTINLKEIAVGVHLVESDPTLADVVSDFGWLDVVSFQVEDAHIAGAIEARLLEDESIPGDRLNALTGDLFVAAVARRRDATVVTENEEDFRVLQVPTEAY